MPLLVAVIVALLAPVRASAGAIETFELPSPLVDTAAPGGRLEDDRAVPKVHVLLPNGTVDITGTRGCRFEAALPFERKLPPACRRAS